MFSFLKKLFEPSLPPFERLARIASAYDCRGGEDDTLQGVLAEAAVSIRTEANRNGLVNWSEGDDQLVGLLLKYLCDEPGAVSEETAEQLRADLTTISRAGWDRSGKLGSAYEEVDWVALIVLEWCEAHPEPIHRAPGVDFW